MADRDDNNDEDETQQQKKKDRPVRRIQILETDMAPELQADVIEFIQQGMDEYKLSKDIARHVKQQLDERGGVWHVIIGSHFACNVTHDATTILNVMLDTTAVLLFRNGPPMKSTE